ncbi:MAG: cyclopropane-fatty-acyl-phospholipid synthase family protein [Steroidobacteraceae bacterium]|jgi:cyclopropane-fatty-acyl-phospholipid synthase
MIDEQKALLARCPASAAPGTLDRALRARLIERLRPLRHGRLVIEDACGRVTLGRAGDEGIGAHIRVDDPALYRALAMRGAVGAGESYIRGQWRCDDLVGLMRLLVRNRDLLDGLEGGMARVGGGLLRAWSALRPNTRRGSREHIAAHYDLGNEFFALFLSPDLMYSSALWAGEDDTLEAASTRKLDAICTALELRPGDAVVEIGTGWGGFALHAARHYGCRVTTTTISREQHALACKRVAVAGLADRVTVLLEDYRDLEGRYDKLVSIEMIEAVGARYLETYFAKVGALLKPGGLALLQAITIEDHRYARALREVDYIKRHVFPGAFIPSVSAMLEAKRRVTDLNLTHFEDFGLSYARTLEVWRKRFLAQRSEVRRLGFDDHFIRLWEFYLAYCEGGFRERSIGVGHLKFAKAGLPYQASLPG